MVRTARTQRSWHTCDEGWWPLLARLAVDLTMIEPGWTLRQAKQKFGSLDEWASHVSSNPVVHDRFRDRIEAASAESTTVCERCGEPGALRRTSDGYFKTLCEACIAKIAFAEGIRYRGLSDGNANDG